MDPITLLVGAGIFLFGLGTGAFVMTFRRTSARSTPQAICSCTHGLGQHDDEGCNGEILRKNMRSPRGEWLGDQWVGCTCLHYDGPQPIEKYLATPTLPPRDGG